MNPGWEVLSKSYLQTVNYQYVHSVSYVLNSHRSAFSGKLRKKHKVETHPHPHQVASQWWHHRKNWSEKNMAQSSGSLPAKVQLSKVHDLPPPALHGPRVYVLCVSGNFASAGSGTLVQKKLAPPEETFDPDLQVRKAKVPPGYRRPYGIRIRTWSQTNLSWNPSGQVAQLLWALLPASAESGGVWGGGGTPRRRGRMARGLEIPNDGSSPGNSTVRSWANTSPLSTSFSLSVKRGWWQ